MGAGSSKPKKRTWWDDFCENCADLWSGLKWRFKKKDNSHSDTTYLPLVVPSGDIDYFDSLDDAADNLLPQSTYAKVSEKIPEQCVSVIPEGNQDNQPAFSSDTVAAAQKSEESAKPVTLYQAGLGCYALAGIMSIVAVATGIYPLFAIAGMLAVLGTALLITAYALNDEEKDGSLAAQAFPRESWIPSYGCGILNY